jgi:hypothetical protein
VGFEFNNSIGGIIERGINGIINGIRSTLGKEGKEYPVNIPLLNRMVPFVYYGIGIYILSGNYDYFEFREWKTHHTPP